MVWIFARWPGILLPAAVLVLGLGLVPADAATSTGTGGWRVSTAFSSPREPIAFNSVVAFSAGDAWAAGGSGAPGSALVVHWAGRGWRREPLPASVRKALTGDARMVASSAADVWLYDQSHWARRTGARWTTGRLPVAHRGASSQSGQLLAFGQADAWFIGQYATGATAHAFAEHFNGRSWRTMPAPPVTGFVLSGASSSAICVMNGLLGSPVTETNVLACWNGRHWHRVPLPRSLGHKNAIIASILVRSRGDIWVGGGRAEDSGVPGIAAHWNGSRWHLTAPRAGSFSGIVFGLLVPDGHGGLWARSDCECGGPAWRLWHFTGGKWAGPALPVIGGAYGLVSGIAAVPGTSAAWAVGVRGTSKSTDGVILVHGRTPR